jgi:hypothetical protein
LFASVWDPVFRRFFKETLFGKDTLSVVGLGATGLVGTGLLVGFRGATTGFFVGFRGATTGLFVGFRGAKTGFFVGFGFVGALAETHVVKTDERIRTKVIIKGSRFNRNFSPETRCERVLSDVNVFVGTAV